MRKTRVAISLMGLAAGTAAGQSPVVYGTVRASEAASPLAFSVVALPSLGREEFTNDRGGFTLRDLPAGRLLIRIRHIGFTPRDTSVDLRAGDTLRLTVSLTRLAIQLDAIHVSSNCRANQDAASAAAMAQLFGQVHQNAEQFALLVRDHPFTKKISRARIARTTDGKYAVDPPELVEMEQGATPHYAPGKVFRPKRGINWLTGTVVVLPVLNDFADSVFIANHCFNYGGDTTIDSVKAVRVTFAPIEAIRSPDIAGTVTLRADTYSIMSVDIKTTSVPRDMADDIKSMRVVSVFEDALPGLPVIGGVESYIEPGPTRAKAEPNIASRGEVQMLVEIRWGKRGPP